MHYRLMYRRLASVVNSERSALNSTSSVWAFFCNFIVHFFSFCPFFSPVMQSCLNFVYLGLVVLAVAFMGTVPSAHHT